MLGLTGAGAAVVGFQVSLDPPSDHGEFPTETAAQIAAAPTYALDSVVIQRNVFRSDRRPAPARYQPGGQAPPLEPRPPLSVAGVVLGRIRAALLRGLPGVDGVRVLAEGETAAGVRVLRVADTVVVVTWRADTLSLPFPGGGS
jgi:hypothetical protein